MKGLLSPTEEGKFEPPFAEPFSVEELENIASEPLRVLIPCHSQGVECCIPVVTAASNAVYGTEAREVNKSSDNLHLHFRRKRVFIYSLLDKEKRTL